MKKKNNEIVLLNKAQRRHLLIIQKQELIEGIDPKKLYGSEYEYTGRVTYNEQGFEQFEYRKKQNERRTK